MRISDWSSDVCSSDLRNLIPIGAKSELVRHINGLLSSWPCAYTAPLGFDSLKSRYKFWLRSCYIQILIFNPKAVSLPSIDKFEIGRASCRESVCQYV